MNILSPQLLTALHQCGWAELGAVAGPSDLLKVAQMLGQVVHQYSRPSVSMLKPLAEREADPSTTSALHGMGKFPYHTDLAHWPTPPRYVVMGNGDCLSNVPTLLLDTRSDQKIIRLRESGRRAVWKVTKATRPFLCSLQFVHRGTEGFRWDRNVMAPANSSALTLETELIQALETNVTNNEVAFGWKVPNTCLVIDNWRVLHARPSVPSAEAHRRLYRAFSREH